MAGFLSLVDSEISWDDLNGSRYGVINGNRVLAQTPSVCGSNSGGTYVGLVSYVVNNRVPTTEEEAADFAAKIEDLINPQGLPTHAPEIYFTEDGPQSAPIMVLYEHQYLAHQLRHREQRDELDNDRVLLYPDTALQSQPLFVALNGDADRLGKLLIGDPDLRGRALELGLQTIGGSTVGDFSEQLSTFLAERRVPIPSPEIHTRAPLPDLPQLMTMIDIVGDCPPVGST